VTLLLPRIYPITDSTISSLSHAEQVKLLLAGGASFIQLREKKTATREFFDDAKRAMRLAHEAGATIIINDRVDVALALGARGVHLGQTDMPVVAARKLLGQRAIIGYSTHNLDQVKAALHLPIDYLALGPIFATNSKLNPDPVVGLEQLRIAKSIVGQLPLVAIGGIDETSLPEVLSAGADSVAMISQILSAPNCIAQNLKKLLDTSNK
jgi:thiamine-phosphate pyrophosphorylase